VLDRDTQDQPVLAEVGEEVRYEGEPIALIAADHPEQAHAALKAIEVDYEVLEPVTDPLAALARGETLRNLVIRKGDPEATAEVIVDGYYEVVPAGPGSARAGVGSGDPQPGRLDRPLDRNPGSSR